MTMLLFSNLSCFNCGAVTFTLLLLLIHISYGGPLVSNLIEMNNFNLNELDDGTDQEIDDNFIHSNSFDFKMNYINGGKSGDSNDRFYTKNRIPIQAAIAPKSAKATNAMLIDVTTSSHDNHLSSSLSSKSASPVDEVQAPKYMMDLYEKFSVDKYSHPMANIVRSFIVTPDCKCSKRNRIVVRIYK